MTAHVPRAAVVLAGGRATRLGGAEKARVEVDGRMLLDAVLDAVAVCEPVIVVGPAHLARPGVRVVREEPAFGGPVAAIEAALAALPEATAETWVLACDLPRAAGVVDALEGVRMPDDADAVVLRDADGRSQPLAGRYRVETLRRAIGALSVVEGVAMRRLTAALRMHEIEDAHGVSIDLDTWEDVAAYRAASRRTRDDADAGREEMS
ncbi:molybdenum cofactor guanylyltransferase [Microbacterium sp. NPDC056234]|uniref:molybdenum cofactor guanylyltransferase n=1 Tax=Microbacterium sp. NPDC056234 TaxID=3345757 RepID=UPI0035E0B84F